MRLGVSLAPRLELPPTPLLPHSVDGAARRVLDVAGALVLLALLAPLLLVAAAAVRLSSRGPVLFAHERCGRDGRPFRLLKFRTMRVDAEPNELLAALNVTGGPTFKARRDPRVTPIGRVLRRMSLDELPQLWHVLRGQMALVGPRPLARHEARLLPPHAGPRQTVRPGLTCIWQVSGRSLLSFDEWMAMDLDYVERQSLRLDLAILARTPRAVLSGRGAF